MLDVTDLDNILRNILSPSSPGQRTLREGLGERGKM